MIDPGTSLLVVVGLGALAILLAWPERGLLWRWRHAFRATDRVRVEDALKHVYDCEAHRQPCTLQSLAGALRLSGNRAAELVAHLQRMELVQRREGGYRLTPDGRGYALRVIRIHRLWERYLSEETGFEASEWHRVAEVREHRTSLDEANRLAARMGHPRFDPHGDPIPTASGEVAAPQGRPLLELPVGTAAEIVHVEDEPAMVYAQILAAGLHPGMQVRVLESSAGRLRLEADSEEHVLAPVVAANLSVVPLGEEERLEGSFHRLSGLEPGESATVTRISPSCRGHERRRMLDLGIIPGTVIGAEVRSPGGDPTAYRIRGALIALRREQADLIQVDRAGGGAS